MTDAEYAHEDDGVAIAAPSDRRLLAEFETGDEAAFAQLVQRHGRLVLGVCRRILRQATDADDAFQATFLVLARKAKGTRWNDSIAGWLYETARRTALKHRAALARRRQLEHAAADERNATTASHGNAPAEQSAVRELGEIVDAECAALPTRFREPILLSYVEGLSRGEIAERLGASVESVKDRLERGRDLLRSRLARRGVTFSAATLGAWFIPEAAQAADLATLAASTVSAATAFATGPGTVETVSAATTLAQGVLQMLGYQKIKQVVLGVLSLLTATGIAYGLLKDDPGRFSKGLRGQIVAVGANAAAPTVTIRLDEFDALLDLDVQPDAQVWLAYEPAKIADLRQGQYASLRLASDHRRVAEIHLSGDQRQVAIQTVDANGTLTVVDVSDDDDVAPGAPRQVQLAPDAIVRLGGLPADRIDLKPGLRVPLELAGNGKTVNAIEADVDPRLIVRGEVAAVDSAANVLKVTTENENDEAVELSLVVASDALIELDGRRVKLAELAPGAAVELRLTEGKPQVRAIRAEGRTNEEATDDAEKQTTSEPEVK